MTKRNAIRPARRRVPVWLGAVLFALLLPTVAPGADTGNPAQVGSSAAVDVLKPILIEEVTPLYFGKVIASTNGSENTFTIDTSGEVSPGGNGNGQVVKDGTPGFYTVTFSADNPISNNLTNDIPASCTNNGAQAAVSVLVASSTNTPSLGSASWTFTGTLTVQSDAPEGVYTCTYTISARYS